MCSSDLFLNAGRARRGELVSCFLIQVTDDMNSIGRSINSALQLSRIGGGVGISLSNLREAGAPIKGYEGAASGVVPVMKLFEDSFSYSNQLEMCIRDRCSSSCFCSWSIAYHVPYGCPFERIPCSQSSL